MIIRSATMSDHSELTRLFIEETQYNHQAAPDRVTLTKDVLTKAELEEMLSDETTFIQVADSGEVLAGVILGRHHVIQKYRWTEASNLLYLEDLIVNEDFRGIGYGKALIEAFQNWGKSRGANQIDLHVWVGNERAISLYKHLKFDTKQLLMTRHL